MRTWDSGFGVLVHYFKAVFYLPVDLLYDGDLVHVEQQPGQVADREHGHDQHQHHGHAVLLAPPPLPPPPDTCDV